MCEMRKELGQHLPRAEYLKSEFPETVRYYICNYFLQFGLEQRVIFTQIYKITDFRVILIPLLSLFGMF